MDWYLRNVGLATNITTVDFDTNNDLLLAVGWGGEGEGRKAEEGEPRCMLAVASAHACMYERGGRMLAQVVHLTTWHCRSVAMVLI